MSEGVRCCNVAFIAADLVLRRVGLTAIVVREGGFFIVELSESREDSAATVLVAEGQAIEGAVIGRGVDERFEDGAGGTLGDGVIQLGETVVASPDEREYLPGMGVQSNKLDLRISDRARLFSLWCVVLLEH